MAWLRARHFRRRPIRVRQWHPVAIGGREVHTQGGVRPSFWLEGRDVEQRHAKLPASNADDRRREDERNVRRRRRRKSAGDCVGRDDRRLQAPLGCIWPSTDGGTWNSL